MDWDWLADTGTTYSWQLAFIAALRSAYASTVALFSLNSFPAAYGEQMADILRQYRTKTQARPSMVAEAVKAAAAVIEVDAGRLHEHNSHLNRELLLEARNLQRTLKREDVQWDD